MLTSGLLALFVTFTLAWTWLRLVDFFAHQGWISSHLSRKIIHTGTGPLFVLCWLFFPLVPGSRYLAALVPLAITLQFFLVGAGFIRDPAAVEAMSRTGDRREILRGPLFYGIVFVALTLIYWIETPIGIIALMLLSGGDGLADILGRRFGRSRLPWNRGKSWAGSLGMFFGGFLFSAGILWVYLTAGFFSSFTNLFLPLILITLVGTLVETLPLKDLDNVTVPLSAIILGSLLF